MELKNFQQSSLQALDYWLDRLNYYKQRNDWAAVPGLAWKDAYDRTPDRTRKHHIYRENAGGERFPHACIKIPTGGGKTFTVANALMHIMDKWRKSQVGLVIWLVPSGKIYKQTLYALQKKGEWIHQHLYNRSAARLKIFTNKSNFTKNDVENFLCIMVLTNQSFIEQEKESVEHKKLRINRMAKSYVEDFFPDAGNEQANKEFLEKYKGLDCLENERVPVRSLINVIRVCRPIVIIDEAHRAKTELAVDGTKKLNPSIILEISATPPLNDSNVLYEVSGKEVWEEEMIKLPIKVYSENARYWQDTLKRAVEKRVQLEQLAKSELADGGRYVRPILVVRVDYTSKEQVGKSVHADEAKRYLNSTLKIPPIQIAVQTSGTKELDGIDLLSDTCQIRYIITKDALKEGWDCSFASVLAILGNLRAETGTTQMLGRVMRQPYAKRAKEVALNSPYIFCSTEDTSKAIDWVRAKLSKEGYSSIKDLVDYAGGGVAFSRRKTPRRKKLRNCKIYFPKIKFFEKGSPRNFNYEADLMPHIKWDKLKYDNSFCMDNSQAREVYMEFDINGVVQERAEKLLYIENGFDIVPLAWKLQDIIPNIFVAANIIKDSLDYYVAKQDFQKVFSQRVKIVEHIKEVLTKKINMEARDIFDNMVKGNLIDIKFIKGFEDKLDWELPEFDFYNDDPGDIRDQNKYAFEKLNNSKLNELEKKAVNSFEESPIVSWWFRVTARSTNSGYFLQGWQKEKVYPDFLLATATDKKGYEKYLVIETKGKHLEGNYDTEYKQNLMNLIESRMNKEREIKTHYFRVVDEGELSSGINALLTG